MNDYDWNPDNMDGGDWAAIVNEAHDRGCEQDEQLQWEYHLEHQYDHLEDLYEQWQEEQAAEEDKAIEAKKQDQLVVAGLKGVVVTLRR
jgi:hypothetical protein